nr:MAG TPA: hypothetical protein [Caudoviricetes sp.]
MGQPKGAIGTENVSVAPFSFVFSPERVFGGREAALPKTQNGREPT